MVETLEEIAKKEKIEIKNVAKDKEKLNLYLNKKYNESTDFYDPGCDCDASCDCYN